MTDYTAVRPPAAISSGFDQNTAFADALARARQIAAKINTPGGETSSAGGTKRPLEDSKMDWGSSQPKKIASLNDPFGAQLAQLRGGPVNIPGGGPTMSEEYNVPDKMVGLIIGRGGEQITRLQSESGCKIQMASDSQGRQDRSCTLTGTSQSIGLAKELLNQIINRGGPNFDGGSPGMNNPCGAASVMSTADGQSVIEILIPGSKVGLIIGKGGETIKSLQERSGAKMVMIQDSMQMTPSEKPLRITGDKQKCEFARQLVNDLLTEKELEQNMGKPGGMDGRRDNRDGGRKDFGGSGGGGQGNQSREVSVPKPAVGVVIGKGGDMIKKIQSESGARIQFQQDEGPTGDKMCQLSGSFGQIQQAELMITELINSVMQRDNQGPGGRGRGGPAGGRGGGRGGPMENGRGSGGGGRDFDSDRRSKGDWGDSRGPGGSRNNGSQPLAPGEQEITFVVPAAKCGIVIGKGGEAVRALNQQTGAFVEISRQNSVNPNERMFTIRGTTNQIDHAKGLINEKVEGQGYVLGGTGGGNSVPQLAAYPMQNQMSQGYNNQQQGWGSGNVAQGGYPNYQNATSADAERDMVFNAGKPAGASNNGQDPNAAWAAYYATYYGQQGGAGAQSQNPAMAGVASAGQQTSTSPAAQAGGQQGATGQPDYSAAWAEYYRSLGMHREAELVEQQVRASRAGGGPAGGAAQPGPPGAGPDPSANVSGSAPGSYSHVVSTGVGATAQSVAAGLAQSQPGAQFGNPYQQYANPGYNYYAGYQQPQ